MRQRTAFPGRLTAIVLLFLFPFAALASGENEIAAMAYDALNALSARESLALQYESSSGIPGEPTTSTVFYYDGIRYYLAQTCIGGFAVGLQETLFDGTTGWIRGENISDDWTESPFVSPAPAQIALLAADAAKFAPESTDYQDFAITGDVITCRLTRQALDEMAEAARVRLESAWKRTSESGREALLQEITRSEATTYDEGITTLVLDEATGALLTMDTTIHFTQTLEGETTTGEIRSKMSVIPNLDGAAALSMLTE